MVSGAIQKRFQQTSTKQHTTNQKNLEHYQFVGAPEIGIERR